MKFFGEADTVSGEYYLLDNLHDKGIVTELIDGLFMVRKATSYDTEGNILGLDFAFFSEESRSVDGTNVELELVMHGSGLSSALRECRHTYWGDEGYIFYPNGKEMVAIFQALSEYFDDMV